MFGVNVVHATRRRQLETPLLASRADSALPLLHLRGHYLAASPRALPWLYILSHLVGNSAAYHHKADKKRKGKYDERKQQ